MTIKNYVDSGKLKSRLEIEEAIEYLQGLVAKDKIKEKNIKNKYFSAYFSFIKNWLEENSKQQWGLYSIISKVSSQEIPLHVVQLIEEVKQRYSDIDEVTFQKELLNSNSWEEFCKKLDDLNK